MRVVALALAACAALALTASPAVAKKKHKKPQPTRLNVLTAVGAQGNFITAPGQISTATANCPSGTLAVGGGWNSPFTSSSSVVVTSSYRNTPQSWRVEGQVYFDPGSVAAVAYCRSVTKPISEASGSAIVPGPFPGRGTASATCPAGSQLISGGFQTPPLGVNNFATPLANLRSGASTWSTTSVNNSSTPVPLTAYAYCLEGIRPPTVLETSSNGNAPAYGSVSGLTGKCPAPPKAKKGKKGKNGKRKKRRKLAPQVLSSGGFSTSTDPAGVPFPIFSQSLSFGDAWLATVSNAQASGDLQVTSQGICVG
jgi:hypothetical protein